MDNETLRIAIGADHLGFDYKNGIKEILNAKELKDFGTYDLTAVDYPDYAHPIALAVEKGEFDFGILIDGTANGVAITANKHQGIRAAICWSEEVAELARGHNNANILCIPARFVSLYESQKIVEVFLTTTFEGGRHKDRINKIPV
ncbi:MAG TPA: ribose 5-phosphate isomerase B [Mucilaginibacter sp.]|jgi:ribose 5-phosphate isomerase B